MKILLVKRDKIGDMLLATPTLTHLRRVLPKARIDVLANDYNAWVVRDHPAVDRIWVYGRTRDAGRLRWSAVIGQLRQLLTLRHEHYDVAIAAGGEESPRAILRTLLTGAERTVAYASAASHYRWRLTDALPPPHEGHEVERVLALLAALGLPPPQTAPLPEVLIPASWNAEAQAWLARAGLAASQYVVVGLSARDAAKQPSKAQVLRWAEWLYQNWGLATALHYIADDARTPRYPGSATLAKEILASAPSYVLPIPDGLASAIGVIGLARTSIVPDSGLMHFAAASPGGVIALFADTATLASPSRWGPRGPKASVLVAARRIADLDDDAVLSMLAPRLGAAGRPRQSSRGGR